MISPRKRVNRAIGAILKAYMNDKLLNDSSCRCAVAIIVSDAIASQKVTHELQNEWFCLIIKFFKDELSVKDYIKVSQLEALTGFSISELSAIEETFEGARLDLRSNLPYKEDNLTLFDRVKNTCSLIMSMDENTKTEIKYNMVI